MNFPPSQFQITSQIPAVFIDSWCETDDDFSKKKLDEYLMFVWERLESSDPFPCEDMQVVMKRVDELKVRFIKGIQIHINCCICGRKIYQSLFRNLEKL